MGYFDPTYFDPAYFDTGSATASGSVRRALMPSVDFNEPDELDDEEALLVLLEVL